MSLPEIKTPALVLGTFPYEENKLIAHLYTRALGRAAFVVSGPKRQRYFQRGALLTIRFYHKPHREVQRLLEVDWLALYENLHHEAARMPYLLLALEVLDQVLIAPDEALFDYLVKGLLTVDKANDPRAALKDFLGGLLKYLGGEGLPPDADWATLEARFAALVPGWKTPQTYSLLDSLTLPTYDRKL
jgi:recombinational DNA repair protein (RecF pathway)